MATREEWEQVVARIRSDADPRRSRYLPGLYELALSDGPKFLGSLRRTLGEERTVDLILDLLADKVVAIVEAETPRALFCTALLNRARSWLRLGASRVVESPPDSSREAPSDTPEEDRRGFVLDARDALDELSERDRGIVVAAGLGEDREEIAKAFGTSRGNVDKIVSRLQKRFRGEGP